MADVNDAQVMIVLSYGDAPLQPKESVMVMQGWNKILASKTSFSEALLMKWRLLVSPDSMSKKSHKRWRAMSNVERNKDLLSFCLGPRLQDAEELLIGLLDGVFRSYCPNQQKVHREAYRPVREDVIVSRKDGDMTLECESVEDYTRLFARCGVEPYYWVFFCEAFLWCLKTHTPCFRDEDKEELEKGKNCAYAKAVRDVALRAIDGIVRMHHQLEKDIFAVGVTRFWARQSDAVRNGGFGQIFYKSLFEQHPQLLNYFAKTDMDSLAIHFTAILDLLVKSIQEFGSAGAFRESLDRLGEVHRQRKIPTFTYAVFGGHLLDSLQPFFEKEEKETKDSEYPVTAKQLTQAYAVLFTELMSIVYYPMLLEEKKIARAREFYESLQTELGWTEQQLSRRMMQVKQEIAVTGTYIQTSEEIQVGARLAWRNSSKCVGRISWSTLKVRDCRHVTEPDSIFHEINQHLQIATAGSNIQSVMTVFKPESPNQTMGTRFWSSQIVRYAAYENTDGTIMGDPPNLELTKYLIEHNLWQPPDNASPFDVLPLVLKVPGKTLPYVYKIPDEYVFEVDIEHPVYSQITKLGYKWTTVPALTNFKMNLGGIVYANIPFNGWFVSTEIVRNLIERYNVGPEIAKALEMDMKTDPLWKQRVFCELERAVLYSFNKNNFTIVDPTTAGKSFCTHVRRERDNGRECPAQWSWIGGFLGTTNDTWRLEMRDFILKPQYEYCLDGVTMYDSLHAAPESNKDDFTISVGSTSMSIKTNSTDLNRPKVLIAYGSETGNAEAAARRLKRELRILKPSMFSLNELSDKLEEGHQKKFSQLICVCSTFGKGEPPGNSERFFTKVIPATTFGDAKFAVLALGSTLYPDFCKAGIALDRKVAACGVERLAPIETVDMAAGGDGAISEWISLIRRLILPPQLEEQLEAAQSEAAREPPVNFFVWKKEDDVNVNGSTENESPGALCVSNEQLIAGTPDGESKSVHKITFELPEGVTYQTGDHISVQPLNSNAMVDRFLKCFKAELSETARKQENFPLPPDCSPESAAEWQSKQLFDLVCLEDNEQSVSDVVFQTPTSLRGLIKRQVDLSLSAKNIEDLLILFKNQLGVFIKELAKPHRRGTVNDLLKNAAFKDFAFLSASILDATAEQKTTAIDAMVAEYPTLVDLLENFQELFLDSFAANTFLWKETKPIIFLADVLVLLPRLQPRYYSISSSNQTSPTKVSITVGVLKTTTSKRKSIEGVCSNYLASMKGGNDRAKISVSPATFKLPKNIMAPLVMVGAGTGLAPIMALLEEKAIQWRSSKSDVGPIHLFYGCRKERDFIYRDIIKKYDNNKMLTLHLALSRPRSAPGKYVQDKIADKGQGVAKLLRRKDTHYFVCGDARMADECFEACVGALKKYANMPRVVAVDHLRRMQVEGRWQTDVWGIISHYEDSKREIAKNKKMKAQLWLSNLALDAEEELWKMEEAKAAAKDESENSSEEDEEDEEDA